MVNTKEFVTQENQYISVETVEKSPTQICVVLPGSGYTEFNNKDKETGQTTTVKKPYINVELDGKTYEWTLNKTTNERLGKELESWETEKWVGAQLKLLVDKRGETKYITATVIQKPEADPLDELEEVVE